MDQSSRLHGWLRGERRGIVIALSGIIIVTPQAACVRWMRALGASLEAILSFQLMVTGILIWVWVSFRGDQAKVMTGFRCHFCLVAAIGVLNALISIGLTVAFTLTYVANVVLLYALDPIWAGALGWLLLGDVLSMRTICALVAACVALLVMFLPAVVTRGTVSLAGSILALVTGIVVALWLTLNRYALTRAVHVDVPACAAFGSCLMSILVALSSLVSGRSFLEGATGLFFVPAIIDGTIVAIVVTCFSIAPKYITSAHIGLMSLVETVLSPLWVYIFFGEEPPLFTMIGGAGVFCVVALHEGAAIREGYDGAHEAAAVHNHQSSRSGMVADVDT